MGSGKSPDAPEAAVAMWERCLSRLRGVCCNEALMRTSCWRQLITASFLTLVPFRGASIGPVCLCFSEGCGGCRRVSEASL